MPSWGYYDEAYEFAVNSPMFYSTTYDIADYRNGMITEVNMWSEKTLP